MEEPGSVFGVEVQDLGDRLLITRRWFYWTSIPIGLLALAWIALTLCKNADNLLNVCNFLFVGLGLLILWIAVLSLINSTEIEVNHQELTVWYGPVPSITGNLKVPVRDIDRLYVKKIRTSGNLAAGATSWSLYMVDRFGKEKHLDGSMPDWNQAQLMKEEIERFLERIRPEEEGATTPPQGL
jgi:hypothetical protein